MGTNVPHFMVAILELHNINRLYQTIIPQRIPSLRHTWTTFPTSNIPNDGDRHLMGSHLYAAADFSMLSNASILDEWTVELCASHITKGRAHLELRSRSTEFGGGSGNLCHADKVDLDVANTEVAKMWSDRTFEGWRLLCCCCMVSCACCFCMM